MASTFCFRVVEPLQASAMIPALLAAGVDPMQSGGCSTSRILSNVTFIAGISDHTFCTASRSCVAQAMYGPIDGAPSTFVQVWRHLFASAVYSRHDWTLKLDINTVFLPHRLRPYLALFNPSEAVRRIRFERDTYQERLVAHGALRASRHSCSAQIP